MAFPLRWQLADTLHGEAQASLAPRPLVPRVPGIFSGSTRVMLVMMRTTDSEQLPSGPPDHVAIPLRPPLCESFEGNGQREVSVHASGALKAPPPPPKRAQAAPALLELPPWKFLTAPRSCRKPVWLQTAKASALCWQRERSDCPASPRRSQEAARSTAQAGALRWRCRRDKSPCCSSLLSRALLSTVYSLPFLAIYSE